MHRHRIKGWRRHGRALGAAAMCLLAVPGSAGAWGPAVNVSQGFVRGILDDNDGVAAGTGAVHSLMYVEDYANADVSVGYSYSSLGSDATARTLDKKCDTPEGIAADGDKVVAICSRGGTWDWRDRALMLYRIEGGRWGSGIEIRGPSRPSDNSASIAMSGDLVVAAWSDHRNGNITLRRSTDGGRSFEAAITLGGTTMRTTPFYGHQFNGRVQVAVRGRQVYVAWFPTSTRTAKGLRPTGIRLRRSSDGGRTFSAPQSLSSAVGEVTPPSMAATDTGVLILHATADGRLRLLRSADGGRTFHATALTAAKGAVGETDLAASGQEVRVIWRAAEKVLLRRSSDGGVTWSATEDTGVARRKDVTINPNVVLFGGDTAVAWSAADPVWGDLAGAWVNITSTP